MSGQPLNRRDSLLVGDHPLAADAEVFWVRQRDEPRECEMPRLSRQPGKAVTLLIAQAASEALWCRSRHALEGAAGLAGIAETDLISQIDEPSMRARDHWAGFV